MRSKIHQKKETPRRDSKRGQSGKKPKKLTNKEKKAIKAIEEVLFNLAMAPQK